MSTVLSVASPAASAKANTMPSLCASPSFKHYRRSTTNRAPRKRTFLLTMTKYNVDIATPPGVASVFANNVAMLSLGACYQDEAALFGGDGNGGFGGNRRNTGGGNNGWGSGNNDGEGASSPSWCFVPVLSRALLGALAIVAAVAAFPAQSLAMMQQQQGASASASPSSNSLLSRGSGNSGSPTDSLLGSSAPTRGSFFPPSSSVLSSGSGSVPAFGRNSSPSSSSGSPGSGSGRPRSKVMHVACKGSTLVVPLTGNGDGKAAAPRLGPWQRAKIVDAPIVLSGNEASVLELPQYRVRESMLV
ncbi:hypothetical protein PLESTF_001655100 [Pleodorina starrii]|nr:hypothetical protein PLESTM_001624700 [Pleodorina starrii]GLC75543.1 hypothetical protein PLESTF_001655100 [Pleodorina starrii]